MIAFNNQSLLGHITTVSKMKVFKIFRFYNSKYGMSIKHQHHKLTTLPNINLFLRHLKNISNHEMMELWSRYQFFHKTILTTLWTTIAYQPFKPFKRNSISDIINMKVPQGMVIFNWLFCHLCILNQMFIILNVFKTSIPFLKG